MTIEEWCLIVAVELIAVVCGYIYGHFNGFEKGLRKGGLTIAEKMFGTLISRLTPQQAQELLSEYRVDPPAKPSAVNDMVDKYKKPVSKFL